MSALFNEEPIISTRNQKRLLIFFLLLFHCLQKETACLKAVRIPPNQRTKTSVLTGRTGWLHMLHKRDSHHLYVYDLHPKQRGKLKRWTEYRCKQNIRKFKVLHSFVSWSLLSSAVSACETCDHSRYSGWGDVKHICRKKDQTDRYNGIVEVLMGW